jgi:CHASE3 domain sensor protein
MPVPKRGLRDIRTVTARVKKSTLPHEVYLRISHIEMEKARKTVESEKARQLMMDIATRLREIEVEKKELLESIGERAGGTGQRPGPPRSQGGFKIRY